MCALKAHISKILIDYILFFIYYMAVASRNRLVSHKKKRVEIDRSYSAKKTKSRYVIGQVFQFLFLFFWDT